MFESETRTNRTNHTKIMIEIGKYNTLEVLRETSIGLYLGDEEGQDVLLPGLYVPENTAVGDKIEVFIYRDSEDRIIATTLTPKVTLHQFALLTARMVDGNGAFLEWGLNKDLLVPYSQQQQKMRPGHSYLVYMYLDELTQRLVASAKLMKFLDNTELSVSHGQEVDLLVWNATDLGVQVIINQKHIGLIYHNELFTALKAGDTLKGYIKKIREDNKIDVALQRPGYQKVEPNAEKILEELRAAGGFLPLTDKSAPEDIKRRLEMSKKTFKKALGALYKQRLVRLKRDGVYLVE